MRKKLCFGKMPPWFYLSSMLFYSRALLFLIVFLLSLPFTLFLQQSFRTGEERKGEAQEGGKAAGGGLQAARESECLLHVAT